MKVPKEYYDEIFEFKDLWDVPSKCGLKIRKHDGKVYVIATELYQENTGTSITYTGETLLDQICKAKQLDPEKIIYVECAPDTNSKLSFYDEEYYIADFKKELRYRYKQLTKEEVRNILGSEEK